VRPWQSDRWAVLVDLDWMNRGIFISVGGRRAGGVIYETYLVG
jgi:hypothetical protein